MIITIIYDSSCGVLERENELNEIKTSSLISAVWEQNRLTLVNVHTIRILFYTGIQIAFTVSYDSTQSTFIKCLLIFGHIILILKNNAYD
jgi:hypothetical protein